MKLLILGMMFIITHQASSQNAGQTLIGSLKPADTLFVKYSSMGEYDFKCGATRKNTLKFYYKNGQLQAQAMKGNETMVATVGPKDLEFLKAIEEESHRYDDPNRVCKYSEGYWYYLNDDFKFRIIDQSCEWHGFSKMTTRLLGFVFP